MSWTFGHLILLEGSEKVMAVVPPPADRKEPSHPGRSVSSTADGNKKRARDMAIGPGKRMKVPSRGRRSCLRLCHGTTGSLDRFSGQAYCLKGLRKAPSHPGRCLRSQER